MTSDREKKPALLSAIFERSLALDQPERKKSRSLTLFEHMAARLDEIAANTRGGFRALSAYAPGKAVNAGEKVGASAERTSRLYGTPTSKLTQAIQTPYGENRQPADQADKKEATPVVAKEVPKTGTGTQKSTSVAIPREGGRTPEQTARKADAVAREQKPEADPKLGEANAIAREQRQAEANADSIGDAIRSGLERLGAFFKDNKRIAEFTTDSEDALGYALGGPIYGAMKELKEAMPEIKSGQGDKAKERKEEGREFARAVEAHAARRRDEKGRFIKPDQNEARRETEQNDTLRDQLELEGQEAKKETKRHKELVRAVRANKRDLLDKFLDRRASRGGRSVLREKTVIKERSAKTEALHKKRQAPAIEARSASGARQGSLRRAGGLATGTIAKGGAALGGMVRMLPGIGQALALGMAAYEGFQGWNDKDLHKRAFGLKDGQEATTGQKASTAAACILDMGGLTSGLLEMFGLEFDKAGVAKSIYEFGSNVATVAKGFMDTAGPLVSQVWGGIGDLADKVWQGAKDVGGTVANFAGGLWEKGGDLLAAVANFATDTWNKGSEVAGAIASWAGSAIDQGAGILSEIWNGAGETISGIWGKLGTFATDTLAKAGELLSNLWKGITDLPGKILDGAKDLATGAIEKGGSLLSDGWSATKSFVGGLFGADKASAKEAPEPQKSGVSQITRPIADLAQESQPEAVSNQITSPVMPELPKTPVITIPAPEIPKVKLLKPGDLTRNIPTSSEAASGQLALEQINQKNREEKRNEDLLDALEGIDKGIRDQTRLLDNRLEKDGPDPYLLDDEVDTSVKQTPITVVSGGDVYSAQYGTAMPQQQQAVTLQSGGATGKLSDRNLSVYNYGNVKLNSKEYKAYASKKDGLMDVGARVLRYNNAPERGWNAKTLQEMVNIYAPPSENDSKGYAKFLADKLGVDKDAQINFKDPAILAKLIRYMPKMEHGADIDDATAMEAAQAVLRGEKARVVGTAPDKHGNYKKFSEDGTLVSYATDNSAQLLRYNAASDGVRLKEDGKTVDLSTVAGVDSLKLQQGVNIDRMHPEAVSRMGRLAADYEKLTGQKLEISEGYRDYAEQVRVKKKYGNDAATPGKSTHGMGNTFDVAKSKIVDVENRLKSAGIDPVQFFKDHGFERTAYRPGASRQHDESWHFEAADLRTAQMAADRRNLQSGKKTGAEYLTAEQRAKYMGPPPQAMAEAASQVSPDMSGHLPRSPQQESPVYRIPVEAAVAKPTDEELAAAQARVAEAEKATPDGMAASSERQTAQAELIKLQHQKALAEAQAVAQTANAPASLASAAPGQREAAIAQARQPRVARNARGREKTESIREIDPTREIQVKSPDQGAVLQALAQIVQAVQAVQATNEEVVSAIRQLAANNGTPNIGMDFSDAASRAMANG